MLRVGISIKVVEEIRTTLFVSSTIVGYPYHFKPIQPSLLVRGQSQR